MAYTRPYPICYLGSLKSIVCLMPGQQILSHLYSRLVSFWSSKILGIRNPSSPSPPLPAPQEARHPLLPSLMACMVALLKDYKTELEDILVADKQVRPHSIHGAALPSQ